MLIKILELNAASIAATTLKLGYLSNDGSEFTGTVPTFVVGNFKLENIEPSSNAVITIAGITQDDATKTVTLTFDGTSALPDKAILSVSAGATAVALPLGSVINTASMRYNYSEAVEHATTPETIVAPVSNSTATKDYQIIVNFVDVAGTPLSNQTVQLDAPFQISGSDVTAITIALTSALGSPVAAGTEVSFTVSYFSGTTPLLIAENDKSSVSAFIKRA